MIRIILIGAATVFIICLVAAAVISVFLAIRIGEEIKDEEHKSFTCYLSGRACVTPHLPCEACRIFAERMQPEQEEPEPLPESAAETPAAPQTEESGEPAAQPTAPEAESAPDHSEERETEAQA